MFKDSSCFCSLCTQGDYNPEDTLFVFHRRLMIADHVAKYPIVVAGTNACASDFYPRNILLITQPLFEDLKGFSEEEKIAIYKELVAPYDEKKLVIKVHPCEKTNHRKYFPDAYIMDCPFPMELFSLNNPGLFNEAITIESTAIYFIFGDVRKTIAGLKAYPKLYEECLKLKII